MVTPGRMRDARDAEDALLLETGDHAGLLAAWHDVIVQRCLVRVRSDAAYDVAQDVCERGFSTSSGFDSEPSGRRRRCGNATDRASRTPPGHGRR